jgi:hypothetical protein
MGEKWLDMPSDSDSDEYPRAPAQKARDENILGVFEATDDPVLTTSEVAADLPIGKRATLNRLEDLVERGEIESKDVGVGRVWWRAVPAEPEPEPTPAPDPTIETDRPPEPTPGPVEEGSVVAGSAESAGAASATNSGSQELDAEALSPRWAFIGSLGRHSIFAGVFLIGLLLTESITTQVLLPVSVPRLFLTSFVFFLIGFPSYAAYRTKLYLDSVDLSLSQLTGWFPAPQRDSEG